MKRLVLAALMLVLAVPAVAVCGDSKGIDTKTATRTITDSAGRVVEIPITVERIVPLNNTPRMIAYLGLADKCVGMSGGLNNPDSINPIRAYAYANKELWSGLPNIGTDSMGVHDYYPEEIIRVNPDVILCCERADDVQSKTGIPAVQVPRSNLFEKDFEEALRLLGDVCGVKERAEEVIAYIHNSLKDLANRTANVPDADKPSVLWAAASFKGGHGIDGVYAKSIVLESIAANDATEGIFDKRSGVVVDKEQIIGWDPKYIFFDSGNLSLVRTDSEKDPDFFALLTAVQDGNLYQCPNNTSYYSNVEVPIANCYYVASILYPEQFADIVFKEKANEIFKFFLGVDDYFSEIEAAGLGWDKITLGNN